MKPLQYICLCAGVWYVGLCYSKLYSQNSTEIYRNQVMIDFNYSHYDQKTTSILNFISGKETLPNALCVEYAKKIVHNLEFIQAEEENSLNSKSFLDELESKLDSVWKGQAGIMPYFEGPSYEYVDEIIDKYYGSETLINTIWKMNSDHGNPKIDFSSSCSEEFSYGSRAYYDPSTNTIYLGIFSTITVTQFIFDWMAELAHADQYNRYSKSIMIERKKNEDIFLDSLCEVYEYISMLERCECNGASIKDKIREIFYINSNLIKGFNFREYEAHQFNEKELWKKLLKKLGVQYKEDI